MASHQAVIVIVGPTACGKTDLAIRIAEQYSGAVICADSRTVYKHLNVGTAKPSKSEQMRVPHYGLDLIDPNKTFSAAAFKNYAEGVINSLKKENKLPIIAGGSGLYVDGVVYNFNFSPGDSKLRSELESLSDQEIRDRALELGITEDQINFKNRRHLQRAVERGGMNSNKKQLPKGYLIVGLDPGMEQIEHRIRLRTAKMFEAGLVHEVQNVVSQYGDSAPGLQAPAYKVLTLYLQGDISLEEAKNRFIIADRQLAKRQLTWFRRNKDIQWRAAPEDAEQLIKAFLE